MGPSSGIFTESFLLLQSILRVVENLAIDGAPGGRLFNPAFIWIVLEQDEGTSFNKGDFLK
jgi:hypothetical protein